MKSFVFAAAAILVTSVPQIALAQGTMPCGDRTAIVERLSAKYGEAREATGLNNSSNLIEVFSSEETGSWTILMTDAQGKSCLIAAGEHWDSSPQNLITAGDDA